MWSLCGIDREVQAVSLCHARGMLQVHPGDISHMPFEDGVFDPILSLDVLYHQAVDENAALNEMVRVLRRGGALVLNLPAFDALRGSHGVAVCGARRYTACTVRNLLEKHNLNVEMIHYWNAWLFMPLLLWRLWSRKVAERSPPSTASDLRDLPGWANSMLALVGRFDAAVCQVLPVPFGTSVFAIATKPANDSLHAR